MKNTKTDLKTLLEEHRQNGNTTWILNAAIDNPKCIIIGYNKNSVIELKHRYDNFLGKLNPIEKMKQKILSEDNKYPIFLSKNSDLSCYDKNIPIILDNSAIF